MFPNDEFIKNLNLIQPFYTVVVSCSELAKLDCWAELLWAVVSTSHNTILCLSCSLEQLCLVISVLFFTCWMNALCPLHLKPCGRMRLFIFTAFNTFSTSFTPIPGKKQAVITNCVIWVVILREVVFD